MVVYLSRYHIDMSSSLSVIISLGLRLVILPGLPEEQMLPGLM